MDYAGRRTRRSCCWPDRCRLALAVAIAAVVVSFASGYRLGVARQEKRLLREFVINAARLGIIDRERLRELADGDGTNAGAGARSAGGRQGEP